MGERTGMTKVNMTVDNWAYTAGGWQFFKALATDAYEQNFNVTQNAKQGGPAINVSLIKTDGVTHCKLLDFMQDERPLVVNFGSCTWPPFMVQLARFQELVADYAAIADFMYVYVKEAHPADGWSFTNNKYNINTHNSLEDRLCAAHIIEDLHPQCPVVVDGMNNEACSTYAAFPERLYVLQKGQVALQGGMGPMDYSVEEVHTWLVKYKQALDIATDPVSKPTNEICNELNEQVQSKQMVDDNNNCDVNNNMIPVKIAIGWKSQAKQLTIQA